MQRPSFLKRQVTTAHLRYHLHEVQQGNAHKFSKILHDLDKYESNHGIPAHLIRKVFCQTISYISSNGTENMENICDLTELIQNKFDHKINVHSDEDGAVLKSLSSFLDMVSRSNQTGLFHHGEESHLIHNAFLKIMKFHLKISLDKSNLNQIEGNADAIKNMFVEYRKFLENHVHLESYSNGFEVIKSIQDIFDILVNFVQDFEYEIEDACYHDLLDTVFSLLEMISNKYDCRLKDYFHHSIVNIAQTSLRAANPLEKTRIAHSLKIAIKIYEKFPRQIQERRHIFLEEIENLFATNDIYGKRFYLVTEEYQSIIDFYLKVFRDCDGKIQDKIRHGLLLKTKELVYYDIFINSLIKSGFKFKCEETSALAKAVRMKSNDDVSKHSQEHISARNEILDYIEKELKKPQ